MENIELALYPFVSEASRYVGSLGFSPDRLITSRALESARIRGTDRVIQSIAGNIERPSFIASDEGKVLTELLSYPFARILVSCINDQYLTRRYALAEAKASYELLKKENVDFLCGLGEDFSITSNSRMIIEVSKDAASTSLSTATMAPLRVLPIAAKAKRPKIALVVL